MIKRNFLWVSLYVASLIMKMAVLFYSSIAIVVLQYFIYVSNDSVGLGTYSVYKSYKRELVMLASIAIIGFIQIEFVNTIYLLIVIVMIIAFYMSSKISFGMHSKNFDVKTAFRYKKEQPTRDDVVTFIVRYSSPSWLNKLPLNLGNTKVTIIYGTEGRADKKDVFYFTEGFEREYEFKYDYKGHYKTGLISIELEDTLGFFYKKFEYEYEDVTIYPKFMPLNYKKNASYLGVYEHKELLSKTGDKFDLREFTNSDSTKYINWRIYAKKQELYVKDQELTSFIGNRMIFFDNRTSINNSTNQLDITEEMFETLSSLMYTIQRGKEKQSLYYLNEDGKLTNKVYKLHKFHTIREEISFIPLISNFQKSHSYHLEDAIKLNFRDSEVIVVTSNLDIPIRNLIARYAKSMVNLRIVYVCPYTREYDIKIEENRLRKMGVRGVVVTLNNLMQVRNEVLL